MSMEIADISTIIKKMTSIKISTSFALSNIMDYQALSTVLTQKECLFLQQDYAFLVLIPYHNLYYDLLYYVRDASALKNIINELKSVYNKSYYIHIAVIGKETQVIPISNLLEECGFSLTKKRVRTQKYKSKQNISQDIKNLEQYDETEQAIDVSFAVDGDEKQILSLLLEEFDICDDNIPELKDIREDIYKDRYIVAKDNGLIVGLKNFKIQNKILYGIYDVIRKDYRSTNVFFNINNFLSNYLKLNNIIIHRILGWRNPEKKRLMKFIALINEVPDGVLIYNLSWNRNKQPYSS